MKDLLRPKHLGLAVWWVAPGIVALASPCTLAGPDNAVADQDNVVERSRSIYDPAGIRAGGFLIFPSLEFGIGRDDNIYRSRELETGDSIRSLRPRIYADSQWQNHALQIDAGFDASLYGEADDEDVTNKFASVAGQLDITRDAWLRGTLGMRELHDDRGNPNSPRTAARPVSRNMLNVRIEAFRRVNRLGFGVQARYVDLAYDDSVETVTGGRLAQDDRDRGEGEVSAHAAWDLASGYQAYLRGTRYFRRYDHLQGDDRYDRDSDGTEVVAGARVDLGIVLYADVFAGHRRQSYDRDDRLPTVDGLTYGTALTWNATPLTSIRGTVRRTVDESTLRRASGDVVSAFELGLDHELRRNLLIGAKVGLITHRYEGIQREEDIVTSGVKGTWLINKTLHTMFGFRFERRESSIDRNSYNKNLVYLDVRVQI